MNVKNNITHNKTYIIKKDEDENDLLDAKDCFEKEEEFLRLNQKFSIGTLPIHLNKNKKKEEKKFPSEINKFKKGRKSRNSRFSKLLLKEENSNTKSLQKEYYLLSYNDKNIKLNVPPITIIKENGNSLSNSKDLASHVHYKLKSFEDLKKIFNAGLKREKDSKIKGTNNLVPIETDVNIKRKYLNQEKQIKYNSIFKSYSEKYLHNLAKRCKKNEKELLVNNVQNYRMRKQLAEFSENNKHLAEKFGDNYWLFSLRRSPKNDFIRFDYYNVGTNEREIWKRFNDYPDKDVEFVNLPYSKGKKSVRLFTEINKDNEHNMPKLNEFNDIKIEGKNLAKIEYNDIINSYKTHNNKIKFKVYKDPKEKDKNYIRDLIYKEIYQLKKNRNNKKIKLKLKLIKK